jgi:hypothetical protein
MTIIVVNNLKEFEDACVRHPNAMVARENNRILFITGKDCITRGISSVFNQLRQGIFGLRNCRGHRSYEVAQLLQSYRDQGSFSDENSYLADFGKKHIATRRNGEGLPMYKSILDRCHDNEFPGDHTIASLTKARRWERRVWALDHHMGVNARWRDTNAVSGSMVSLNDPENYHMGNEYIFSDHIDYEPIKDDGEETQPPIIVGEHRVFGTISAPIAVELPPPSPNSSHSNSPIQTGLDDIDNGSIVNMPTHIEAHIETQQLPPPPAELMVEEVSTTTSTSSFVPQTLAPEPVAPTIPLETQVQVEKSIASMNTTMKTLKELQQQFVALQGNMTKIYHDRLTYQIADLTKTEKESTKAMFEELTHLEKAYEQTLNIAYGKKEILKALKESKVLDENAFKKFDTDLDVIHTNTDVKDIYNKMKTLYEQTGLQRSLAERQQAERQLSHVGSLLFFRVNSGDIYDSDTLFTRASTLYKKSMITLREAWLNRSMAATAEQKEEFKKLTKEMMGKLLTIKFNLEVNRLHNTQKLGGNTYKSPMEAFAHLQTCISCFEMPEPFVFNPDLLQQDMELSQILGSQLEEVKLELMTIPSVIPNVVAKVISDQRIGSAHIDVQFDERFEAQVRRASFVPASPIRVNPEISKTLVPPSPVQSSPKEAPETAN